MGSDMAVTHDGDEGSELVPRRRRRFVRREDFAAISDNAPTVNLEAFRADQDAAIDNAAITRDDRWSLEFR